MNMDILFIKTKLLSVPLWFGHVAPYIINEGSLKITSTVSEFNEFEPRLKFPKNRFQLSAGLNLEKFNTFLSETNHILAATQIL